jgi:ubiquinone/menaquinone biosynthesis C-methylase UbiE
MEGSMKEKVRGSAREHGLPAYFDMQARIGHTKHIGGWDSTVEIVEMMSLQPGMELLYVGSGSGVAAVQIAQTFGCHVTGVDLLDEMVSNAREWAARNDAENLVEFRVADAQSLPFEDDRFDAVLCESVNIFIPEPEKAAREYFRVVKPGGCVGLNESVWYETPPEEGKQLMRDLTGQELRRPEQWIELLKQVGLTDIQDHTYPVDMKKEFRAQMGFLSITQLFRVIGRAIKSIVVDADTRDLMRMAGREPRSAYDYMGYGLYVGWVPEKN